VFLDKVVEYKAHCKNRRNMMNIPISWVLTICTLSQLKPQCREQHITSLRPHTIEHLESLFAGPQSFEDHCLHSSFNASPLTSTGLISRSQQTTSPTRPQASHSRTYDKSPSAHMYLPPAKCSSPNYRARTHYSVYICLDSAQST
jgi:ABC-type uncharacterized transport system involved in gliding motility auxiliary subunit